MHTSSLNTLIDTILHESGYRENPFFKGLNDGTLSKEDFIETQVQFYRAVVFFSRPMAALAAKIPTPELRIEIVRNVWEEHGEGDFKKIHGSTFTELLFRLAGLKPEDIERRVLWPELRAFNTVLSGACVLDEYLVGVGMMGMIERMFSDISAWIGSGIVARGWLSNERMIHYALHQELDVKHSDDFFAVLEKSWSSSPDEQYKIEQGLRLGAYSFNELYNGLYNGRARRWMNPT